MDILSASKFEDISAAESDNDLLLSDIDYDDHSMEVDPPKSDLKLTKSQPKQGPAGTGELMRRLSKPQNACHTTNSVRT